MNAASIYFLVQIATGQFIGPMESSACAEAGRALASRGITCRVPSSLYACDVPGHPGSYTTCPHFDVPHVTVK